MSKRKGPRLIALARHPWEGARMLEAARQLNARCIAQLIDAVRAQGSGEESPAVQALRDLAPNLDERACARAGRCPVLLLHLKFDSPDWWDRAGAGIPEGMHLNAPAPLFSKEEGAPLLYDILLHAWSLSRGTPRAAGLLLGMAPRVTQVIGQLTVQELERIARDHAPYVRPRWEDSRAFWRGLLRAAIGTNNEALADVHLHALSLLGGELVPLRSAG